MEENDGMRRIRQLQESIYELSRDDNERLEQYDRIAQILMEIPVTTADEKSEARDLLATIGQAALIVKSRLGTAHTPDDRRRAR